MDVFTFTLWALAIMFLGVPALFFLTAIIISWIESGGEK